ncbi:MAG TPA: 2-oxo-4-hydroxy-4-carboxy-5-ureidoimidazoline decarboxylase [Bacteroidota bacterium]|nr:2-oxo-4-hydroxy-4-carboxy-5-ureidoimidazoline decarboxylase [Bacteroidota bacterium]
MTLDRLNSLPAAEAHSEFLRCCGSDRWAGAMTARRPFSSRENLLQIADELWKSMASEDWIQAFSSHPKIGDLKNLQEKFAATAGMATDEQSGVRGAPDAVLVELADSNRLYEEKFGYIFIVCATGKSAPEMLGLLKRRINNDPATELRVAAAEQSGIMILRLEKLFA